MKNIPQGHFCFDKSKQVEQKGFVTPLVILVVILVLGGVAYFYTQNKNKEYSVASDQKISPPTNKGNLTEDFSERTKSRNAPYKAEMFDSLSQEEKIDVSYDNKIRTLLFPLRTDGELFLANSNTKSFKGFCSSQKVLDANNEIAKIQGRGLKCFDGNSTYSVSAPLMFYAEYFCVDSKGAEVSTVNKITTTSCQSAR